MLHVYIHSGTLNERNPGNQLAALDIAYEKRSHLADYKVSLVVKGHGQVCKEEKLRGYPRWSGSLWDLIARALTRALYEADQAPPAPPVDRRCAYATKLCVAVHRATLDGQGFEVATGEVVQNGKRGFYTVNLEEDILGRRSATFSYGSKRLVHTDLVLRALCWALFNKDTLDRRPALILPPAIKIDGVERFDIENLDEPARTGFIRYCSPAGTASVEPMPKAEDYVRFLTWG
jgi:hypothetical protein